MRRDPQKVAWLVLVASFVVFCFLAVSVPLGVRWWIINFTRSHQVSLEVISGTVLLDLKGVPAPVGVTDKREVSEGSSIRTDANSRASLLFFDGSEVTIFPNTEVRLIEMRSPFFSLSTMATRIVLEQRRGLTRVGPTTPSSRSTDWRVITPQARISLEGGSYSVEVSNEVSQIAVRAGSASVEAQDKKVILDPGQRVIASLGEGLSEVLPAARNLVVNGDFGQGLSDWKVYSASGKEGVEGGKVEPVTSGGRGAIRLYRSGEDGTHTEAGIRQDIDQDVSDFVSLQLRLDLKVDFHSLSGGGYLSSEYPVIVRVDYEDAYGSATHWYHGFYYQNDNNNPTLNGEQVRASVWYPYEVANLFEVLDPKPFFIRSVQVYASGWNYDSLVTEIGLFVE